MRLERLRLQSFGEARAELLVELAGDGAVRELVGEPELVAQALAWALHGDGPESRRTTEVELEWSDGAARHRLLRRGKSAGVKGWSGEGEGPAAKGDPEVARWLEGLGLPGPEALLPSLLVRAAALGAEPAASLPSEPPPSCTAAARRIEDRVEHLLVEVESRADALRLERAEALAAAAEHLGGEAAEELALEELEDRRREAELRLEAARAAGASLGEAARRARELIETARARQERLDQLEEARRRLREAERSETERRRLERELERAESAAALAGEEERLSDRDAGASEEAAARALRRAESDAERARAAHAEAAGELRRAQEEESRVPALRERLAELEDLEGVRALLERTRASLEESAAERERQMKRRGEAAAAAEDLQVRARAAASACERARAALGEEGARVVAELREELGQAEARLAAARRLADAQARRREVTKIHATTMIHLDRARRALDTEQRQLDRRLSGEIQQAPDGGLESQRDAVAGLQADVDHLASEEAEQDSLVQELGSEVLRLRQELGALAYRDPAELEHEVQELRARLADAGAPAEALARAEAQHAELLEELGRTQGELDEAESALHAARAREESERDLASELETRVPATLREPGALEAEREELETRLAGLERRLEEARAVESAAAGQLRAAETELVSARTEHERAAGVLEAASEELARVVVEAGFRDLADYREAKRAADERGALRERVEAMRSELEEAREAHRELEGLTNVPVLRESDRRELEREEFERRQRERKERLQADRVHRDRELLEGLRDQLEAEVEESAAEERRLAAAQAALEKVAAATAGFSEQLAELRERHAALSRLADLTAGRQGPAGGFAEGLAAQVRAEAAARAGQWCRRLSAGELHLELALADDGPAAELREVRGRGRRAAAEAPPEERWLAGLCAGLAAGDAALLLDRARRPGLVLVDRLPEGLSSDARARVRAWLDRLAATGPAVLAGVADEEAGDEALRLDAADAAAARSSR